MHHPTALLKPIADHISLNIYLKKQSKQVELSINQLLAVDWFV